MAFNLDLRIVGRGVRGGEFLEVFNHTAGAPTSDDPQWPDLDPYQRRDLLAFQAAGWRFTPQPENELGFGINGAFVQKGLLTVHPKSGLVIVRDQLVIGLVEGVSVEPLKARHPEITPLPFGTNVHQIRFDLPEEMLDTAIAIERVQLEKALGSWAVRFVDPVLVYNVALPDPEPLDDPVQWQWDRIKLSEAFASAHPKKGDGTRVAVIDRGFFESTQLRIEKLVDHDGTAIAGPMKHVWHGTFCAALVGGTLGNNFGNGAAPNCRVILVAVGDEVSTVNLATALNTSMNLGADVISCSVAPPGRSWDKLDTLLEAVREVEVKGRGKHGTLVVWSVFNENRPIDPGSLEADENIICVAPSDRHDVRAPASGFGEGLDLIAPGVAVVSILGKSNADAKLMAETGGSFAAPCVAGVASLVLSVNSNIKAKDLRKLLWDSSDPPEPPAKQRSNDIGWGRVNALKAVEKAKSMLPPAPNE
jgi:subtilisin family serine protease